MTKFHEVKLVPTSAGEETFLLARSADRRGRGHLWKRYIQLTEAEWAFRITKDELEIRPIWHQKEKRVQAHILL